MSGPTSDSVIWTTQNKNSALTVALTIVDNALQKALIRPPAAIFDVDETLLMNHANDDRFAVQETGKQMFEYLVERNVPVFLVTARRKSPWAFRYLMAQLERLGYHIPHISGVYMLSKEFDHMSDGGAAFKRAARQKIGEKYVVVLNAGDRWGDVMTNHDNGSSTGTAACNIKTRNRYVGVSPEEPYVLHGVKFPDEK